MKTIMKGFTLLELIVTMAVMAILLGIGVPSLSSSIKNNSAASVSQTFVDAVAFTRMEAIRRNKKVSVCASHSLTACDGNWTDGFIVFIDGSESNSETTVSEVIRTFSTDVKKPVLNAQQSGLAVDHISFNGLGYLLPESSSGVSATAASEGCTGDSATLITISVIGRMKQKAIDCNSLGGA